MGFRSEHKPAFEIVGMQKRLVPEEDGFSAIPVFWNNCVTSGVCEQLGKLSFTASHFQGKTLGVFVDYNENTKEIDYLIAVEVSGSDTPNGMVSRHIPAGEWAVFETYGPMPDSIQALWRKVMSENLTDPSFADPLRISMEVYPSNKDPSSQDFHSEVWILRSLRNE